MSGKHARIEQPCAQDNQSYLYILYRMSIERSQCCLWWDNHNKQNTEQKAPIQTSLFCKCLKVLCHNFPVSQMHSIRVCMCDSTFSYVNLYSISSLINRFSIACRLTVFVHFARIRNWILVNAKKYISIYPILNVIEILLFRFQQK